MTRRAGKAPAVKTALLLIGHGSRVPEANGVLEEVATTLRRRLRRFVVEPAFLELVTGTRGSRSGSPRTSATTGAWWRSSSTGSGRGCAQGGGPEPPVLS